MQHLIIKLGSDICKLAHEAIIPAHCALFIELNAPIIMENSAAFLISPEYSCEVELGYCNRNWYTLDKPDSFAERVLKYKPEYLKHDNFINYLY